MVVEISVEFEAITTGDAEEVEPEDEEVVVEFNDDTPLVRFVELESVLVPLVGLDVEFVEVLLFVVTGSELEAAAVLTVVSFVVVMFNEVTLVLDELVDSSAKILRLYLLIY